MPAALRAHLMVLVGLIFPLLASADCYQLFDKDNRLVLQSSRAPVDLSRPSMSEEVVRVYPGHVLIVAAQEPCGEIDELSRQEVKLPAHSLERGPIRISDGAGDSSAATGTDMPLRSCTRPDGTVVRMRAAPGREARSGYSGYAGPTYRSSSAAGRSTRASTSSAADSSPCPGDDVGVRSYTRRDGTRVRAHSRGCPGSKSK